MLFIEMFMYNWDLIKCGFFVCFKIEIVYDKFVGLLLDLVIGGS